MAASGKIYIFLNSSLGDVEIWVAVAEDGFALASRSVPLGLGEIARMKLTNHTKWRQNYEHHYPDGYDLEFIENINDPQWIFLLNRIRILTDGRAVEQKQQHELAAELIKTGQIKRVSKEEMDAIMAAN